MVQITLHAGLDTLYIDMKLSLFKVTKVAIYSINIICK